ncbi:MAG TPA: hypothetical protein VL281_01485 [Mycobacteriales bacterium]|jgi:hypothetical protein|nr:hypothetical protein [Mycobacteriales bacterium]
MSLTIRFVAAIDTELGPALGDDAVADLLAAAGLTPRDPQSFGATPRGTDPRYVLLRATVVADDPDEVSRRIRHALQERGAVVVDFRFTAEPLEPAPLRTPGVAFDESTGTLRVECTGLAEDLTLELVRGSDSITGVVTGLLDDEPVREAVGGVQRVVVARHR